MALWSVWRSLIPVLVLTYLYSPSECSLPACQRIDAALTWNSNNKTYFFSGSEYIAYSDYYNVEEEVKNVSSLVSGFPTSIDAAVNWFRRNQSMYFKGCHFYKLNETRLRFSRKRVSRLKLPCEVDAAVNVDGRRVFVFKGCRYWSLTLVRKRIIVVNGSVAALGLPCDLHAAFTRSNGTSYVIKGDVMWTLTSEGRAETQRHVDDLNLCSWRLCANDDANDNGNDDELADDYPCNGDPRFCRLRLDQVTLAGSHNAGSGFDGGFGLLSCWLQNHELSVLQQLQLGLRYLDVDSSWQHCGLLGSYHNFACGGPLCKIIKQIKRFLRENRHEILVINFNHEMRDHDLVIPALLRQLTSQVGGYLNSYYRFFGEWPTLRHAVNSNKRLFVIMDRRVTSLPVGNFSRLLWLHSNSLLQSTWRGDVTVSGDCGQVVNATRLWCEARSQVPLLEVVVFGTGTSCVTAIADTCLPLVHSIARDCQTPRHGQGRAPNVLLVDYPERAPRPELSVVHAAYLQNVRNVARLSRDSCEMHVRAAVTWPETVNGERLAWMSSGSQSLLYNWNISLQLPRTPNRLPATDGISPSVDAAFISPQDPNDICFISDCLLSCMPVVTSAARLSRWVNVSLTSLSLPCEVHAAYTDQGRTYFFKGCQYWQRDLLGLVTGPYPVPFGLPCDVTAALESPDGSIYFFKGENYWQLKNSELSAPQSTFDWSADLLDC